MKPEPTPFPCVAYANTSVPNWKRFAVPWSWRKVKKLDRP